MQIRTASRGWKIKVKSSAKMTNSDSHIIKSCAKFINNIDQAPHDHTCETSPISGCILCLVIISMETQKVTHAKHSQKIINANILYACLIQIINVL